MNLSDKNIAKIGWASGEGDFIEVVVVGRDNVVKIDSCEQFLGDYSIVWLQVWKRSKSKTYLAARHNARNVDTIEYVDEIGEENEQQS